VLSKAKSHKERKLEICFKYLVSRENIAFLRHTAKFLFSSIEVLYGILPLSDQMTNAVIFKYRTHFLERLNEKYCKWNLLMMIKMIMNVIINFQIIISLRITG
jgi:hypothetical protein